MVLVCRIVVGFCVLGVRLGLFVVACVCGWRRFRWGLKFGGCFSEFSVLG